MDASDRRAADGGPAAAPARRGRPARGGREARGGRGGLVGAASVFVRAVQAVVVLSLLVVALAGAVELGRTRVEKEIYRQRLVDLTNEYAALVDQYNEAVRRTAVTELVVEDGALSVSVRTAAGELKRVATPADPSREVYVDFALVKGRVWIRRVFDENTPPSRATLVDPGLAEIDWNEPGASHGQAVYRSLGEGRWVVSVSGSGALELTKAPSDSPVTLAPPPEVRGFAEMEQAARDEARKVGWLEVLRRAVFGGEGSGTAAGD